MFETALLLTAHCSMASRAAEDVADTTRRALLDTCFEPRPAGGAPAGPANLGPCEADAKPSISTATWRIRHQDQVSEGDTNRNPTRTELSGVMPLSQSTILSHSGDRSLPGGQIASTEPTGRTSVAGTGVARGTTRRTAEAEPDAVGQFLTTAATVAA